MSVAAATGGIAARSGSLFSHLDPLLAARGSTLDHAQAAALERLQQLCDELTVYRQARQSKLKRLFSPPPLPRGLYLWGSVGRGKSFLMDSFYALVPIQRKTRVHFHAFMRSVHEELRTLDQEPDPLVTVAARIASRYRLICFDEFHVSDIADAMILGRLLAALLAKGVVFVITSNYPPEGLYPDGLQRQKFLPAIALIREKLDEIEVDGGTDYRLRLLEQVEAYHIPPGPAADAALDRAFERMRSGADEAPQLDVEGRVIVARRRAGGAVWFDFSALCDGPRSQRDYLELAECYSVLLLSGVPEMNAGMGDRARRFTWLVDILYDHRVKLLMSAEVPPAELYVEGPHSREFPRTVSRLIEMQTREYMASPHVLGLALPA